MRHRAGFLWYGAGHRCCRRNDRSQAGRRKEDFSVLRTQSSAAFFFISSSEESRWKDIRLALEKISVLTVSDMPEFTQRGGMIQFQLVANRVRFEVNLAATERAGLAFKFRIAQAGASCEQDPLDQGMCSCSRFATTHPKETDLVEHAVSGVALLLACAAFGAYELTTFRTSMVRGLSIQHKSWGPTARQPSCLTMPIQPGTRCWHCRPRRMS